jgi:hypothetical protein
MTTTSSKSIQARAQLCAQLVFQRDSQRSDLMDGAITRTELVALLLELLGEGHCLEITAVRSDHSDDSALGEHSHANGYCADVWPLASRTAGDYLDAGDSRFQRFLADVAKSHWLYQVGLAGTARTFGNLSAAGITAFADTGADHVHLGS